MAPQNYGLYHMLESIQYGLLYLVAAFLGGVGLDWLFPVYDEKKKTGIIFRETVAQCIMLILLVYFIRSNVKSIPIAFPAPRGYIPYKTAEFNGEMMMGFVFVSSQLNLLKKIDLLSWDIYKLLFKEERVAESAVNKEVRRAEHELRKDGILKSKE
jgi:uncharacterized integral membrane protein